jgi:hypothetical protein
MEHVAAILINSGEKKVQEVYISNSVKKCEFFSEAYKLMGVKIDYEIPELDLCTNLYNEDINFNPNHHNVLFNPWNHGWGPHVKTNNPDIFITDSKLKHTYLYRKILIIGEVLIGDDKTILIKPLKFTVEEVANSLEWRFKKKERQSRMSYWEAQADAEEKIREIQNNAYYCNHP